MHVHYITIIRGTEMRIQLMMISYHTGIGRVRMWQEQVQLLALRTLLGNMTQLLHGLCGIVRVISHCRALKRNKVPGSAGGEVCKGNTAWSGKKCALTELALWKLPIQKSQTTGLRWPFCGDSHYSPAEDRAQAVVMLNRSTQQRYSFSAFIVLHTQYLTMDSYQALILSEKAWVATRLQYTHAPCRLPDMWHTSLATASETCRRFLLMHVLNEQVVL